MLSERSQRTMLRKGMKRKEKREKRRTKAAEVFAAGILAVSMLTACGDSRQTEEELVVPREQAEESGGTREQTESIGASGSVARQVQAPEQYQWSMSTDTIEITADAPVVIPDVQGIRTKKVTGRPFTQEDYDRVSQALFDGSTLWNRTNGPTVSELEEKIAGMEELKQNGVKGDEPYAGKEETLDEQIAMYREAAKTAPEEPVIEEVPAIVDYDGTLPEGEGNQLYGQVTLPDGDYWVYVDNSLLTGEIRRAVFSLESDDYNGSWNWLMEDTARIDARDDVFSQELSAALSGMQLQPEEAREETEKLLGQMEMESYIPSGGEYCYMISASETEESSVKQTGYMVHCTREEEGVPVTYTHEDGTLSEGALIWWPPEEINFVYTDRGLVSFEWVNPCQIEELSSEAVFLMPFTEIRDIFQEMILKTNLDGFSEAGDTVEIHVDEVRLGYMRIQEAGEEEMAGTLVPVWDFSGSRTCRNAAGEVKYMVDNVYESLLTINAMDGTIVER